VSLRSLIAVMSAVALVVATGSYGAGCSPSSPAAPADAAKGDAPEPSDTGSPDSSTGSDAPAGQDATTDSAPGDSGGDAPTGPDGGDSEAPTDAADSGTASDGADGGGLADSGDSGETGPADTGLDVADAASNPEASVDAGACNSLTLTAPAITIVAGTGTVPAGTGGTPVSGTYFLTAFVVYPVDGSPSFLVGSSITEQFVLTTQSATDSSTEAVILAPGSTGPVNTAWTTVLSGMNFTNTSTCPIPGVVQAGEYTYDSTAKTLTIYYDDEADTYTLQ